MQFLPVFLFTLLSCHLIRAQELPFSLEAEAQNSGQEEIRDEPAQEALEHLSRKPLNINGAEIYRLAELGLTDGFHIDRLADYRKRYGNLFHPAELQAVPGWDQRLVANVLPYVVCLSEDRHPPPDIKSLLSRGEWQLVLRFEQPLQIRSGFRSAEGSRYYPGLPQSFSIRFRYRLGNYLSYGLIASQDAGEPFKLNARQAVFDQLSFHVQLGERKWLKTLILGDFLFRPGQGLTHWNGFGLGLSAAPFQNRRLAPLLQPNTSSVFFDYLRGAAFGFRFGNWEVCVLGSVRKASPAGLEEDTAGLAAGGFNRSGLHRSTSELFNRHRQTIFSAGGALRSRYKHWNIGLHGIWHRFAIPLRTTAEWEDLYRPTGNSQWNLGLEAGVQWKNQQLFGEMAINANLGPAVMAGWLFAVGKYLEGGLVGRWYSPKYHSLMSRPLGRNPSDEAGLYWGLVLRPSYRIEILTHVDVSVNSRFRYRLYAPAPRLEWQGSLRWKLSKKTLIQSRYLYRQWSENVETLPLRIPEVRAQHRCGLFLETELPSGLSAESRIEWAGRGKSWGWMAAQDLNWKSGKWPLQISLRMALVQSPGWEQRIYTAERDVLYGYSIPALYGTGLRSYGMLRCSFFKILDLWLRAGISYRTDVNELGTGPDRISSPWQGELKIQLRLRWAAREIIQQAKGKAQRLGTKMPVP